MIFLSEATWSREYLYLCTLILLTSLYIYLFLKQKKVVLEKKSKILQLEKWQSNVLVNIRHEIKTPVSVIIGHLEVLKDKLAQNGIFSEDKPIQSMILNGQYLVEILNSLSAYETKPDFSLGEKEAIDTQFFFNSSIQISLSNNKSHNTKIFLDINKTVPKKIMVHRIFLRQILVNLINNAVKFTEFGKIDIKVHCMTKNRQSQLKFSIKDSGIGIRQEQIDRIFKPFFQCESTMSKPYKGLGLGLTICKKLIKKMNGKINVISTYEKGTTFFVSLPIDLDTNDNSERKPIQNLINKKEFLNNKSVSYHKILIVEDQNDIIELYKIYASEMKDVQTLFAKNGKQAVDIVKEHKATEKPVDIIFMDLRMPILNGYQATKILRQRGYRIPIVAVTAHGDINDNTLKSEYGFTERLLKPINQKILREQINRHVSFYPTKNLSGEKI